MTYYRCYFLGADDHIKAAEDIESDTRREAVQQALRMIRERPHHSSVELWEGTKRIYSLRSMTGASDVPGGAEPQRH
jgi:hypothetical protein